MSAKEEQAEDDSRELWRAGITALPSKRSDLEVNTRKELLHFLSDRNIKSSNFK